MKKKRTAIIFVDDLEGRERLFPFLNNRRWKRLHLFKLFNSFLFKYVSQKNGFGFKIWNCHRKTTSLNAATQKMRQIVHWLTSSYERTYAKKCWVIFVHISRIFRLEGKKWEVWMIWRKKVEKRNDLIGSGKVVCSNRLG